MQTSLGNGSTKDGNEIAEILRLMDAAIDDGERGLEQRRSENVRRCAADMSRGYEAALSLSLKLSLTKTQCQTFDDKSHQVETIRTRLERRSEEFARQEAAARVGTFAKKRSDLPPSAPPYDSLSSACNAQSARAMSLANAGIMKRTLRR